ncbi:DUF2279 domain-containing protein [Microbulbifer sediminum]|uniref:DUF2279 domain-containing protein n=1 Tax=Microbulbifer sediminum TaxID=2904250 RepID=UPI001F34628D|nr:DUF2279 domain-containing protein [Microbulbifer sediminum]
MKRIICTALFPAALLLHVDVTMAGGNSAALDSGLEPPQYSGWSGYLQEYPVAGTGWEGLEFARFKQHLSAIPYETTGVAAATLAVGLLDWGWGSSEFKTTSEGFFQLDTANGGMDKLGHIHGTYLLSEFFADSIHHKSGHPEGAEATAATLAWLTMLLVELGDGFSSEHGFASEDIVANTTGAGLSYLRRNIPGLRQKLDYRIEYWPSGNRSGFKPHSDYSGQKYVLALKFSGFGLSRHSPSRYLELHGGYYARGFTLSEELRGEPRRRELYIGLGLNLGEILFDASSPSSSAGERLGRRFFEYVQLPLTYIASKND